MNHKRSQIQSPWELLYLPNLFCSFLCNLCCPYYQLCVSTEKTLSFCLCFRLTLWQINRWWCKLCWTTDLIFLVYLPSETLFKSTSPMRATCASVPLLTRRQLYKKNAVMTAVLLNVLSRADWRFVLGYDHWQAPLSIPWLNWVKWRWTMWLNG